MKRKFWVISPNAQAVGNINYWLEKSRTEGKTFVGYGSDKKHGNTFENSISINDCVIIAQGAGDNRTLYLAGIISSNRQYDEVDKIFYRKVDYLLNENDFKLLEIELNSNNAWGDSSNPGTIYELKVDNLADDLVINKIENSLKVKLKMRTIDEKIELLNYKKQIILQGPPGTGKTRLAKEMAIEMTKEVILESPVEKIDSFFKNHAKPTAEVLNKRSELENLLNQFQEEFKKENLEKLPLEKYAFGKSDNDTFCYWLEYVLYDLGAYTGQAGKFKIYWKKDIEAYSKIGFLKDASDEDAMRLVAEQLKNIVNETNLPEASEKLSKGFILKILHSYYPDKYFPINNEKCIDNALKLFGKEFSGLSIFDKSIALQRAFEEKRNEFGADIKNYEFMAFLFTSFDMKGLITIKNDVLISKGDYKIIQFHPAYSYEDFVRGIVASTNSNSQVEYKVENKILSDFAQKAIDNPTAKYVLVIDEINRANLPSVLGELIYALEYRYDVEDEKNTTVDGMYSLKQNMEDEIGDTKLRLPKNLFIIGTMNTADRSVGHIDYAIRRRFAFVDVLPDVSIIDQVIKDESLKSKSIDLFNKISELFYEKKDDSDNTKVYLQSDFKSKDVQLGHSYFLAKSEEELSIKLKYEIQPLLNEYVKDGILSEDAKIIIDNL